MATCLSACVKKVQLNFFITSVNLPSGSVSALVLYVLWCSFHLVRLEVWGLPKDNGWGGRYSMEIDYLWFPPPLPCGTLLSTYLQLPFWVLFRSLDGSGSETGVSPLCPFDPHAPKKMYRNFFLTFKPGWPPRRRCVTTTHLPSALHTKRYLLAYKGTEKLRIRLGCAGLSLFRQVRILFARSALSA